MPRRCCRPPVDDVEAVAVVVAVVVSRQCTRVGVYRDESAPSTYTYYIQQTYLAAPRVRMLLLVLLLLLLLDARAGHLQVDEPAERRAAVLALREHHVLEGDVPVQCGVLDVGVVG